MAKPAIIVHSSDARFISLMRICEHFGVATVRGNSTTAPQRPQDLGTSAEAHVIWGMPYNYTARALQELGTSEAVYFAEQGWFTQRTGCYIDKRGTNALSSIRDGCPDTDLNQEQVRHVGHFGNTTK